MEAYPPDYLVHNLPLVLLSGLGTSKQSQGEGPDRSRPLLQEGGFKISTDLSELRGPTPALLLETFLQYDASLLPRSSQILAPGDSSLHYKFLTVGRTYTLPARKAPPPPRSPRLAPVGTVPPPLVLHSPLSPLTPSSPLFPNGIVTPLWITKHESRLPAAYISVFSIVGDPSTSSLEDNKLKYEINNIRNALTITNYKTRLVIVLIGSGRIDPAELEERLGNIRRACNVDVKGLFFLLHGSSKIEVSEFVKLVLVTIRPSCLEYYRDLSKHARRKRNRNSIPPPTVPPIGGTSQLLPAQGWLVRYEFKLGIYAEFRQEMDAACRNYETAYDSLFGPEVIEAIAAWSPRFNEARMLADVIALRIIRCLLWTGQYTLAVRSWSAHGGRIEDLINRRGKGTASYGWRAWQNVWARAMADLISRAEIPALRSRIFLASEQQAQGEVPLPWEQLHHQGYWLQAAAKYTQSRREFATQMPEDDRISPGKSPASKIASKADTYDTYLVPQPYDEYPADERPGYDYGKSILFDLFRAFDFFTQYRQLRMTQSLQLMMAVETVKSTEENHDVPAAENPVLMLKDLWERQTARKTGWWQLVKDIGQTIYRVRDINFKAEVGLEFQNGVFGKEAAPREGEVGAEVNISQKKPSKLLLTDTSALLSTSVTFVFGSAEGYVGGLLLCQLCVRSLSVQDEDSLRVSSVLISFDEGLKPILIKHDPNSTGEDSPGHISDVELSDSASSKGETPNEKGPLLEGHAYLVVRHLQPRILNLRLHPRDAGIFSVTTIEVNLHDEFKEWTEVIHCDPAEPCTWWEIKQNQSIPRPFGMERDVGSVQVLPKPPKLVVEIPNLRKTYYTNELIMLQLSLTNEEDNDILGTIDARLISPMQNAARPSWKDEMHSSTELTQSTSGVILLPQRQLDPMTPGTRSALTIILSETSQAVDHELEIVVNYELSSNDSTTLVKTFTVDISVIRPFEANYTFSPRLHTDPWPNFFEAPAESTTPSGLKQSFQVTSNIYSFADEPINVVAILLIADKVSGGAICSSTTGILLNPSTKEIQSQSSESQISADIEPDTTSSFLFDLLIHRQILGDPSTVSIDLALEVGWKRPNSDVVNTTILEVPRFTTPMSEPRVLLQAAKSFSSSPGDVQTHTVTLIIENPSTHFLTFNVTMESSEDFAFSGPKSTSISLVPVSRTDVQYRIMPLKTQDWVKVGINVVDAYFGQTLRVVPAGEGVKSDRHGTWIKI